MGDNKLVSLKALEDFRLDCTDPDVTYYVKAGDIVCLPNINAVMHEMIFQLLCDGVCELAVDLDSENGEYDGEEYSGHTG